MEKNKVSIVVPVYNAGKYLKRCLDSLVNQTYSNLEIIIVNDGSTDNSKYICETYQQEDERILLLEQKNQGVSSARNFGLKHVTGDYVMFVDSDDWIEKDTCEQLLKYAVKEHVSIVTSSPINVSENGEKEEMVRTGKIQHVNVASEFSFLNEKVLGVVWGSLYRQDCVKNLEFETDIFVGEDTIFYAQAVSRCQEIVFVSDGFYNYVNYSASAAHGKIDEKKMTNLKAWEKIADIFKHNQRIRDSAKGDYVRQCANFINRMCATGEKENPYYTLCKKGMKNTWKYIMKDPNTKNRLYYRLMYFVPCVYCRMKLS